MKKFIWIHWTDFKVSMDVDSHEFFAMRSSFRYNTLDGLVCMEKSHTFSDNNIGRQMAGTDNSVFGPN